MTERAIKWEALADIQHGFGSISFAYTPTGVASLLMHGSRNLSLRFSDVIALHFEDECPGNFPTPSELPMLRAGTTFPLIKIEQSRWLEQWLMYQNRSHFFLVSSDDLVHVLAGPKVEVSWA